MASKHVLLPEISSIDEKEALALFKTFGITKENLPLISVEDPALKGTGVQAGDVVKCMRRSAVTGKAEAYYRLVVGE